MSAENLVRILQVRDLGLDDANVEYIDDFLDEKESKELFDWCMENLNYQTYKVKVFGKEYDQPRLSCFLGTNDYEYSGATIKGDPLPASFETIIDRMMAILPSDHPRFNAVLINLYRSGEDHISPHSDKEEELEIGASIAGLSLGAVRHFDFTSITNKKEKVRIDLASGSLVIMNHPCQQKYKHAVPKQLRVKEPRISLTFRCKK